MGDNQWRPFGVFQQFGEVLSAFAVVTLKFCCVALPCSPDVGRLIPVKGMVVELILGKDRRRFRPVQVRFSNHQIGAF